MNPAHPSSTPHDPTPVAVNPFEPPRSDLGSTRWQRIAIRRGLVIWLMLFALNLILPTLLAREVLKGNKQGELGMGLAIGTWSVGGFALLLVFPRSITAAIVGAAVVAASQLMPILQIFAGAMAIGLAQSMGPGFAPDRGLAGGFLVTLITGGELIAVSLVLGLILQSVGRWLTAAPGPTALPPRTVTPATYPRLRPPP